MDKPDYSVIATDLSRSLPVGGNEITILTDVSFSIRRGHWVALTGPSGSGKSTLLGIIAGLDSPTSGSISIDGKEIATMKEGLLAHMRNERIGIVFQSFNLISTLTAQENVEAPLYVKPGIKDISGKARRMLELVGLGDRLHHLPSQLSGGQQQRVAIARALVTDPSLLIADEPTGNLDSATGSQILDLFTKLKEELGITLIMATHDSEIAARADHILHLVDGRLTDKKTKA